MPGLDTNIVVHKIPLEEGCKPVKQKLRRAHPDIWIKVKAELEKQWDAGVNHLALRMIFLYHI
jgi:hypothetical protein